MFVVGGCFKRAALAAVVLTAFAGAAGTAAGQSKSQKNKRPRHETNASREARIQRTIADTYSHKYEAAGGGGYMRFRSGDALKKNNEVSWNAQTNYYFNPKWAAVGEAQGSFGNAHALTNNIYRVYNPQINEYFFQGGGSYRFYMKEKVALSAQALGGVGWGIFSGGSKGIPATLLGLWPDGFRPSFQLAVTADYNIYPNLAVRFTPTYQASTFGGEVQNNLGFNAGIVYRFKRQ